MDRLEPPRLTPTESKPAFPDPRTRSAPSPEAAPRLPTLPPAPPGFTASQAQAGNEPRRAASPAPIGLACLTCNQRPAKQVQFRRHTGMLLFWMTQVTSAPMCRQCGVGAFRRYMDYTLWAGWWGIIAFFANFYAIGANLFNRAKLHSLPLPPNQPARGPGRSMFLRVGPFVALGFLTFIVMAR